MFELIIHYRACITSIIGLWLRISDFHGSDWSYGLGETVIAVFVFLENLP